jgi:hypothetical protein
MYSISNPNKKFKITTSTKKTLIFTIKMQQFQEKDHHIQFLQTKIM